MDIGKVSIKGLVANAAVYFALAIACLVGADYITAGTWRDVILLIAGLMLGGVAAMVTLVNIALKLRKAKANEPEHPEI